MNKDNENDKMERLGKVLGPWDWPLDISAQDLVQGTMNLSGVSPEQWEVQELIQTVESTDKWKWNKINLAVSILEGRGEFSIEKTPEAKRTCIIKLKKRE